MMPVKNGGVHPIIGHERHAPREFLMPKFKPASYSTVSPYLIVSDAAATIKFLEAVCSGELLRGFPDEQGRLTHAEVRIDDTF